jgi:hypothetical protein
MPPHSSKSVPSDTSCASYTHDLVDKTPLELVKPPTKKHAINDDDDSLDIDSSSKISVAKSAETQLQNDNTQDPILP